METIFESEVIKIERDEEINAILMNWKPAFLKSDLYKEALEQGLAAVHKFKAEKWLANLKDMKIIALADEKWTNEVWFPKAINSSLRWMGIVVSQDVFNKVSVQKIMAQDQVKVLTVDNFLSVEDAHNWLREKHQVAA